MPATIAGWDPKILPRPRPRFLGEGVAAASINLQRLRQTNGYTTLATFSKGRLTRCTVPGSTPNCLAITRTPGLPGIAKAFLMRSISGAIRGRPSCLPSLLAPR